MAQRFADPHPPTAPHSASDAVFVEAPARLHFGMLDLRGALGRKFGGIGAAAPSPSLVLEAQTAPTLHADGPAASRAAQFARRVLGHYGIEQGAHIRIHAAIPAHSGLGSGTQLALAVARALAELYALPSDTETLARVTGRAKRSAIGTWIFAEGGFVLEGGRRRGSQHAAPRLARFAMPDTWRCVIAIPPGKAGMSGEAESAAFTHLPPPPERSVMRVSHLVLMALLPALAEGDLATFGRALTEIQCINGRWFAPVQGGAFSPGASTTLIERMTDWGAAGVGQSSWGPAVYGIVAGDEAASKLANLIRDDLAGTGVVYAGPFANSGARIWRGPPSRAAAG
ncbi:MAG TPA: beta-ribofuranosylaminobenzene 5'-phosphate synthase family protein [Gemmatimonadaceae bacterium]